MTPVRPLIYRLRVIILVARGEGRDLGSGIRPGYDTLDLKELVSPRTGRKGVVPRRSAGPTEKAGVLDGLQVS
jgi:hypothetical protein